MGKSLETEKFRNQNVYLCEGLTNQSFCANHFFQAGGSPSSNERRSRLHRPTGIPQEPFHQGTFCPNIFPHLILLLSADFLVSQQTCEGEDLAEQTKASVLLLSQGILHISGGKHNK